MKRIYLLSILFLAGCQTISGSSRFNPEVTNVQVKNVAVLVPNDTRTQKSIVEEINNHGTQATELYKVVEFISDNSEIPNALKKGGITHILIVSGSIGKESTRYAGSINNAYTNVNAWGTTQNVYATANTSSFSTPIYSSSNYASANGKLFEVDGPLIWVTDVELEAQGTFYTGAKAMSEGVAEGLVAEMEKSGLLPSQ
nr:hypothetical protein [uncultured Vibrio sp.]